MVGQLARTVIAGLALTACQRLTYERDEPANHSPDESSGEWSEPWSPDLGPPPAPIGVCTYREECECYGGADASQHCDVVLRERSCGLAEDCGGLEGDARDQCIVDAFCQWGNGHVEGNDVFCDDAIGECAGTCDEEPSLCDADGDGVSEFDCGLDGLQCTLGQYCVALSEEWDCGDECWECESSRPPTWICVDPPVGCDGIVEAGVCIRAEQCDVQYAWFEGHDVRCASECWDY